MIPDAPPERRVGEVLLDKLRIVRWIGGGGMGDVYEVEHLLTHHRRALKVVRAEHARESRYVERLLREASIAGRLATPFVVETLDAGRLEDGSAYVLMELLEGHSLQDILEAEGPLPARRVARLMAQVAEGAAVAHAAGVVHRDLKPENVFVVRDRDGVERVKILDFGISKFLDTGAEAPSRLTREGTVVGTPFYMAPEQASGRGLDGRSDVWSIGVMMYEALTGRLPFDAETIAELFVQIGAGHYVPLQHRRADLDPGFVAIVETALRPDPERRHASADALRQALQRYALPDESLSETASELEAAEPIALVSPRTPAAAPSRSWRFAALLVLFAAVLGGLVYVVARPAGDARTDAVAAAPFVAPEATPTATAEPNSPNERLQLTDTASVEPVPSASPPAGPSTATAPSSPAPEQTAPVRARRRPTPAERAGLEGNPYAP